jgi:hypothetical protein
VRPAQFRAGLPEPGRTELEVDAVGPQRRVEAGSVTQFDDRRVPGRDVEADQAVAAALDDDAIHQRPGDGSGREQPADPDPGGPDEHPHQDQPRAQHQPGRRQQRGEPPARHVVLVDGGPVQEHEGRGLPGRDDPPADAHPVRTSPRIHARNLQGSVTLAPAIAPIAHEGDAAPVEPALALG